MKKGVILIILLVMGFGLAKAEVNIPNLEATMLYDMQEGSLVPGLTSKILSIYDFDMRVGYTMGNKSVMSLSYNLKNLEKIGPEVRYLWDSMQTSCGIWVGYDFKSEVYGYGFSLVLVEVNFK